ncbi:DUF4230 domain-containing protein [Haloferula helveola]|uniref:DUF4230 domain-containing protein n=1 Tax=Haloferula helveola TaxID=490095 RepID=A0ABN6H4P7_9BACT|nr:DUF4230 domain-containing protein [Haloferula helveola]
MEHQKEIWRTVRWSLVLGAFVLIAWLGVRFFQDSARSTASGIERGLDKILGALTNSDTRIVEGRAEVVERNEIAELALLELRMSATRSYENQAFILKYVSAGTKQLIIRGDYRVTAGYRLKPGVSLQVVDGTPVANFPEPEILGVELIDFQVLNEKDGWWNGVTAEDRAKVLRELRLQMRSEAEKSGALDVVEATLRTRMKDLIGADQVRIEHGTEKESTAAD